jgi:20S proteasome subunit alpha 4
MVLKANAIGGRSEKAVQEYLEKNWTATMTEEQTVKMTIKALLEVVDSGSKNMEIAVMRHGAPVDMLDEGQIQTVITEIEREIEEAKAGSEPIQE